MRVRTHQWDNAGVNSSVGRCGCELISGHARREFMSGKMCVNSSLGKCGCDSSVKNAAVNSSVGRCGYEFISGNPRVRTHLWETRVRIHQ
eukprot:357381-Chlamydomonas_euryale.AAC.9